MTDDWCEIFEIEILDPDGWRGIGGRSANVNLLEAITVEDFATRIMDSTIRHHNNDKLKILLHIV
jgi:hypothetical protein